MRSRSNWPIHRLQRKRSCKGKVKVSDDKKIFAIVNPAQQITFDRNRDYAEQNPIDSRQVTSWVEKDIFFDDITMANAVDQLEKRFDISIHIGNEGIKDCRFTATFVKGEDLAQILRILCDFNNATLKEDGLGGFIIQGGECSLWIERKETDRWKKFFLW